MCKSFFGIYKRTFEIIQDEEWIQTAIEKMIEVRVNANEAKKIPWLEDKKQRSSQRIKNENPAQQNLRLEDNRHQELRWIVDTNDAQRIRA